jgi:hypothetical protein
VLIGRLRPERLDTLFVKPSQMPQLHSLGYDPASQIG